MTRGLLIFVGLALACSGDTRTTASARLVVTSPAFADGAAIPAEYTCDGDNVSPPLAWSGAPAGTQAFVVIVDDPDAPEATWVHWIVYGLPAATHELPRAASTALPEPARHGKNDWGDAAWGGACPPTGRHRYVHRVLALDAPPVLVGTPTRAELDRAIEGHVIGQGELVGTYQRRA